MTNPQRQGEALTPRQYAEQSKIERITAFVAKCPCGWESDEEISERYARYSLDDHLQEAHPDPEDQP